MTHFPGLLTGALQNSFQFRLGYDREESGKKQEEGEEHSNGTNEDPHIDKRR